jgi:trigger factor
VIDRQVGREAVLSEAVNDVLPKKYVEALQSNDLQPLAQPEIEVTRLEDNDTLEFTAEVEVKPEITVPDYDGLEAQVDDVEVTDEDVEEQLQTLRERFGTLVDVDRAAADGDFVTLDLKAIQDGEVVEGGEVSGMSYQVGRGGMIEGLDEALVGMSAGEDKTFSSQLVGGDLVGQDVEVAVTVTQVQQQELPELDDEFAQMASEFDTVEELTADVRERLGRGKRLEQAAAARDAVLEALLEKVEIPLPDGIVTDELNARRQNIEQQLAFAGITMEKYLEDEGQTQEEFEAEPRSSCSTRSRRRRSSASTRTSSPSTWCVVPSSPARTRRSSRTTCSSTTTSRTWSRRSCAARRWRRSWRARPSRTPPATWSS